MCSNRTHGGRVDELHGDMMESHLSLLFSEGTPCACQLCHLKLLHRFEPPLSRLM